MKMFYITTVVAVLAGFAGGVIGSTVIPRKPDPKLAVIEALLTQQLANQSSKTFAEIADGL